MLSLPKYSVGIGDRFGCQAKAQLQALQTLAAAGIIVAPVWNKSFREHTLVGSMPADVRVAADAAVRAVGWCSPYFVDADHINLKTVNAFLAACDFFTLDVAEWIGNTPADAEIEEAMARLRRLAGEQKIAGLERPLFITPELLRASVGKYLLAVREAGQIYRRIRDVIGDDCVIEVSMDESDVPQKPVEIFLILAMLAEEGVPAQTIAPKFTGRFNKGVDYHGDLAVFRREFREDVATVAAAARRFNLPANLKISVHSGSDKFSLYPIMREAIQEFGAGLHLKTAGTTWLEELIGLIQAGGKALEVAREICVKSLERLDEFSRPYAAVIEIDRKRLPAPGELHSWSGERLARALRHAPEDPLFNPHLRQALHIGYKAAAEMGEHFLRAVTSHAELIGANVSANLQRHLAALFPK